MEILLLQHGYEPINQIGRGGFSIVYRVYSSRFKEEFAAKVIEISGKTELQINEIANEVRLLISLVHPNIINLYDYFYNQDFFILITEYCPAGCLKSIIAKNGPIYGSDLISITYQIIQSLKFLHKSGVAHLDVKPQNILIDKYGRPKLTDFGTAKMFKSNDVNEQYQCSKAFAPPEVLNKLSHDPFKRDIWSLGVTIYNIATNRFPFNVEDEATMIRSIQNGIIFIDCELPIEIRTLVTKCLIKNPSDRIDLERAIKLIQIPSPSFQRVVTGRSQIRLSTLENIANKSHINVSHPPSIAKGKEPIIYTILKQAGSECTITARRKSTPKFVKKATSLPIQQIMPISPLIGKPKHE